jgi:hypothetical protein
MLARRGILVLKHVPYAGAPGQRPRILNQVLVDISF